METVGVWINLLFRLFRQCFLFCRFLQRQIRSSEKPQSTTYGTSAVVERIAWRSKIDIFESIRPSHFLGVHETYAHPDYVLADNVILCSITSTQALFLEMPKSIKAYTGDHCPFLWLTLFQQATKTITMPLDSFNRLAETDARVNKLRVKALYISTCGRCGSTLLAKLVQTVTNRVLVLSEPDTLQRLQEEARTLQSLYGKEGFERLIRNATLLSFKPVTDVDAVIIKIRMLSMRLIKHVIETTPEVRHVYVQRRNRLKAIQSWERAFSQVLDMKLFHLIHKCGLLRAYVRYVYRPERESLLILETGLKHLGTTMFEDMLMLWTDTTLEYKYCQQKYDMASIFYEDMTAEPLTALKKVFELLDFHYKPNNGCRYVVNERVASLVSHGMKDDSQQGTPLAMDVIESQKITPFTPEIMKRVNEFLTVLDIPVLE